MLVYGAHRVGSGACLHRTKEEAIEHIANEIKNDLEYSGAGDKSHVYSVVVQEMTEEEFENLPEWGGY